MTARRVEALLSALSGLDVRVEADESFSLVRGGAVVVGDSGPLTFATLEGVASALAHMAEARRDDLAERCREMFSDVEIADPGDPIVERFAGLCEQWAACKRALEESEAGR